MGLNLCWLQIQGMLSVWLETKHYTGNPYCIKVKLRCARPPQGSVQPGINPNAQAVTYGYRIQTWPCDMTPMPFCCFWVLSLSYAHWEICWPTVQQTKHAPAPLLLYPFWVSCLRGPQRLLKAPGRGRR